MPVRGTAAPDDFPFNTLLQNRSERQRLSEYSAMKGRLALQSALADPIRRVGTGPALAGNKPVPASTFREELSLGAAEANLKVGAHLLKMATGDPTNMTTVIAAIWWSKARMGWIDASRIENPGPAAAAVNCRPQVFIVRSAHDVTATQPNPGQPQPSSVTSEQAVVQAALTCRQDDQGIRQRPT
jgi:hypothetical protein